MGEKTMKQKYYDIHMITDKERQSGYSVFVKADDENEAVEIMTNEHLYEEPEDLSFIDYTGEITAQDYYAGTKGLMVITREQSEHYVLEDDDKDTGGVSYAGETLDNFLDEAGITPFEDDVYELGEVNKALQECGTCPVMMDKIKETEEKETEEEIER